MTVSPIALQGSSGRACRRALQGSSGRACRLALQVSSGRACRLALQAARGLARGLALLALGWATAPSACAAENRADDGISVATALHAFEDDRRFGTLHFAVPGGAAGAFVVLFSDADGWTSQMESAAQALAGRGAFVAGVDLPRYRAKFDQPAEQPADPAPQPCRSLAGDPENLSLELQRALGYSRYHTPILAGIGEGAVLAEITLSEALPSTFSGAVSLDPAASITTRRPLCTSGAPVPLPGGGFTYPIPAHLPGFWTVGFSDGASARRDAFARQVKEAGAAVAIETLPREGGEAGQLLALLSSHINPQQPDSAALAELPLVELPAGQPSPLLAIIISGDGGWRDLDKTIAEMLSRDGVSVVGWDSLRYFWRRKTPERCANDLAAVIEAYKAKWHAAKVALVGYSFGADILPIVYARLPEADKASVAQLSLLALSDSAEFEIKVAGWLGKSASDESLAVEPAFASVDGAQVQCFYGEAETDSLCPRLAARGAEVIRTRGSHHFGRDYAALAQRILDGLKRRAAAAPASARAGLK